MINVENHAFSLSVTIDTIGKISYFHYHYRYREKMDFRSSLDWFTNLIRENMDFRSSLNDNELGANLFTFLI